MYKYIKHITFCFLLGLLLSCGNTYTVQNSNNEANEAKERTTIDEKVASLLKQMTLEEKIGQMNQYNGFWEVTGPAPTSGDAASKYEDLRKGRVGSVLNVTGAENVRAIQKIAVEESRLGIPLLVGFDVIHGYKTISPIPLAEAASWDLEAIKKSAEMAALEASAAGINWTFAPMVDISRDARWGRVMEGAGEDPYLGSLIAKARVEGFQGDDLKSPSSIIACAKHFAAYGFAEAGRDYNTVDIGNNTLFNVVFPPFIAAKEAGVRTFMNSFNELNGVPATGSKYLQRDILKGKWGFEGFVVSDWGSITEMIAHGHAKDGKQAAEIAVKAGSDMDMESHLYAKEIEGLFKENSISEAIIDDAVRRILKVKFELGLFDNPYMYSDALREKEVTGSKEIMEGGSIPNVNFSAGSQRARYYQIRGIGERSQFREPINPSVGLVIERVRKGTNFKDITNNEVAIIVKKLNHRPRKCLNYQTPNEVFLKSTSGALTS